MLSVASTYTRSCSRAGDVPARAAGADAMKLAASTVSAARAVDRRIRIQSACQRRAPENKFKRELIPKEPGKIDRPSLYRSLTDWLPVGSPRPEGPDLRGGAWAVTLSSTLHAARAANAPSLAKPTDRSAPGIAERRARDRRIERGDWDDGCRA